MYCGNCDKEVETINRQGKKVCAECLYSVYLQNEANKADNQE